MDAGAGTTDAATEEPLREAPFQFSGKAPEYFGIWIVNLFLTILTLGIYSAWATVRTRRYLQGSLSLDGHAFGYHANPVSILIGRAIVLVIFAAYAGSQYISPFLYAGLSIGLVALFPWVINRALRFHLRMTSYRNVRFGFAGAYWRALGVFILWPLASVVTFGLAFPFAVKAGRQYFTNNASYGGRPFHLDLPVGPIYRAMFATLALAIVVLGVVSFVAIPMFETLGGSSAGDGAEVSGGMVLAVVGLYAVVIPVMVALPAFFSAMVTNAVARHVALDGHRARANFHPVSFAWLALSNVLLVIFSLGLLYPWAVIRLARYRAHHLTALIDGDLDGYVSQVADKTGALGDEMANAFDIDVGVI